MIDPEIDRDEWREDEQALLQRLNGSKQVVDIRLLTKQFPGRVDTQVRYRLKKIQQALELK